MADDKRNAAGVAPPEWPDLSGRLEDFGHVLPIRVYYEDTDFSGLVYHASYIRWCERGRSDYVRLLGLQQKALFEDKSGKGSVFFVVRRMELDYLRPAMMDDVLEVITEVSEMGTASITLSQKVCRGELVLFKASVIIVLLNEQGRPQRLNEAIKRAFDPAV
ncbi:MAG: tol-pal system-associated acyl-CoA thioesterase [Rhodomicrobium sp.]|nr:MAG: tol-pal system-associated acyl-CoA thioesterase [Rhodomicrobium sp.]